MFDRFTDRARRAVVMAQDEARRFRHGCIGTEHLLLGLIDATDSVAAKTMEALNVSHEAVSASLEEIIGSGEASPAHIPFTPRAKKIFEQALVEALRLNHNYIGTEHLLLGLVREGEGVACQILVRLGHDSSEVRAKTLEVLETYMPPLEELDFPEALAAVAQSRFKGIIELPITEDDAAQLHSTLAELIAKTEEAEVRERLERIKHTLDVLLKLK